jgi:guanine nucleotide-binding protein alpha-1 subunit
MRYASAAWKQERASWRAVIQLNLIRSVVTILEALQAEMENDPISTLDHVNMSTDALLRYSIDTTASDIDYTPETMDVLTSKHQVLKLRLSPLQSVEEDLKRRLGACLDEDIRGVGVGVLSNSMMTYNRRKEFGVRALKDALGHLMRHGSVPEAQNGERKRPLPDEATEVIASCRDDIKALWMDEAVRGVLAKRRLRVEDSAGLSVHSFRSRT